MKKANYEYTILVVDNDVGISCLIQKYLKRKGFQTAGKNSGCTARSWLCKNTADLMLVDIRLPDMTGEELINELKIRKKDVPFIIITGHGGERIPVEMMKLGAQDYLIKDGSLLSLLFPVVAQVLEKLEQPHRLEETEEELQKSEERFRLLAENSTDLITRHNIMGEFLYASPASRILLGYDPSELIGKSLFEFCHKDHLEEVKNRITTISTAKDSESLLYRIRRKDHSFIWFETTLKAIQEQNSQIVREIQSASRDITSRRKLEVELSQAHKMEAVGVLAAGIAHEINSPMQFIKDNTRFVLDSMPKILPLLPEHKNESGEQSRDRVGKLRSDKDFQFLMEQIPLALKETLEGIKHVISITMAMKEFSHSSPLNKSKIFTNLNKGLRSAALMARNEIKYVAELNLNLDSNLPLIWCFPDDLNQVFLNLIINAAHAIAEKIKTMPGQIGSIDISTKHTGDVVLIKIRDTGTGIKDSMKQRIFEPFFTTKDVGQGTGMGMSIVHEIIVNKHQGKIEVDSEFGEGTTFGIYLPIIRDE